MNKEKSGKIFRFKLDFNKGFGYAEQIDFTDVYSFDGILIIVYKLIDESIVERTIDEIRQTGILLGPLPIVRYPPQRGKDAWKLIGVASDCIINEFPNIKFLTGSKPVKNWSKTKGQWYKYFGDGISKPIPVDYEEVRYLERSILNTCPMIASKITMMQIIKSGESVMDYYNLMDLGDYNTYVQLVNTYYDKETAEKLLSIIDDYENINFE